MEVNNWPGHRIKRCRKYLSLSQNKLAIHLGITQPTVAKLENGYVSSNIYAEKIEKWWQKEQSKIIASLYDEIKFIKSL